MTENDIQKTLTQSEQLLDEIHSVASLLPKLKEKIEALEKENNKEIERTREEFVGFRNNSEKVIGNSAIIVRLNEETAKIKDVETLKGQFEYRIDELKDNIDDKIKRIMKSINDLEDEISGLSNRINELKSNIDYRVKGIIESTNDLENGITGLSNRIDGVNVRINGVQEFCHKEYADNINMIMSIKRNEAEKRLEIITQMLETLSVFSGTKKKNSLQRLHDDTEQEIQNLLNNGKNDMGNSETLADNIQFGE